LTHIIILFPAFLMMQGQVFKFIIDSIVWAFKHPMRDISEMGLTIMMEFLDNIQVCIYSHKHNHKHPTHTHTQSHYSHSLSNENLLNRIIVLSGH
jgi:hypothetical protein